MHSHTQAGTHTHKQKDIHTHIHTQAHTCTHNDRIIGGGGGGSRGKKTGVITDKNTVSKDEFSDQF